MSLSRLLSGLAVVAVLGVGLLACRPPVGTSPAATDTTTVLWAGAVTDSSARVVARVPGAPGRVRLAVAAPGAAPARYDGRSPPGRPDVYHFRLSGLQPDTPYRYTLAVDGVLDSTRTGRLRTVADGPLSFRVALSSCAETGSRHPVFDAIRRAEPTLFLHLGDLHYEDITTPRPARYRRAFHRVHASGPQAALFRSTALAYVWDDHDYGPNNSSRRAPAQDVAQAVYREYVPHYPLARGPTVQPIYQAFTVGRVRFLLTDLRSARTPPDAPDSVRSLMGAPQKRWFKEQLRRARTRYPLVAWVSTVPWIGAAEDGADHWGGYAAERRELATYIDSIGMADRLVVLSGDAHMVALDDGTHSRYGRDGGAGVPVVHAGALDQTGSTKGGPYTHGPFPNPLTLIGRRPGQYVLMDVQDDGGDRLCVTWTGRRYTPRTDRRTTLLEWRQCFPRP